MGIQEEPPNMGEDTSIRVSEELANELFDRKQRGEAYEDVIWRLLGEPGITITYDPDETTALFRCNFPGADPDDRDERVEELFEAVLEAGRETLEEEGMHITGGGEGRYGTNSKERLFGSEDDIPMG